jgi:hypothetical protein
MGLDQFAKTRNPKTGEVEEFMDWRKHNALHGWMENLWRSKGCPNKHEDSKEFNCIPLELTHEDLDALEKDLLGQNLPETTGFFFGPSTSGDKYYLDKDLRFIQEARTYLDSGLEVAYDSWW